jgi:hypothetical protein
MKSARLHAKGFTLIASLLLLLLLSGISIGLMMMVNTEGQVGGGDLQNNASFRATEGGVEKMTSDLAAVFQNAQSPSAQDICNVGAPFTGGPAIAGITWKDYQVTPGVLGAACPSQANFKSMLSWGNVASGPNYGLYAQIVPVNMLATAQFPGGQEVSLIRNAQVALIPVFQFGVFSESDLSFFPGAAMDFAGPVHTNGDLYLAGQATVTFHSQLSAWGNVVRTDLANGNGTVANGYTSTIYIPTANDPLACTPTTNKCKAMDAPSAGSYGDGSVQGMGGNPPASPYASAWGNFSKNTTSHEIINGGYGLPGNNGTGATQLSMPFVNGTNHPYEIIRRPPAGEDPTSALGDSREYNMAQIHVLLSDDPNDFPGGAQSTDVRLANITTTQATATGATHTNDYGITMTAGNYASTFAASTYQLYFAAASNAVPSAGAVQGSSTATINGTDIPDWPVAPTAWYGNAKNASPTLQGLQPTGPVGGPGAPILSGSSTSLAPPTLTLCPPAVALKFTKPTNCPATPASPYYLVGGVPAVNDPTTVSGGTATWNLIDGYLRVEYQDASGAWHPATAEWLNLGFARGLTPPTAPGPGGNPINPNAILLLQEPADRGTDTTTSVAFPTFAQLSTGLPPSCTATSSGNCTAWAATPPLLRDTGATQWEFGTSTTAQSVTAFNWYPINFYDDREGENRDVNRVAPDDSCTTNGVMNAVEIDVGNLKRWLSGAIAGNGGSVDFQQQNGYVLYFSDRRGMLLNPHPPINPTGGAAKSGDSGLEDVIDSSSSVGTPDGVLEPPVANSPEDDNQNGFLDNFGPLNMGLGFYNGATNLNNLNRLINSPAHPDPFGTAAGSARITSCMATARKNWVSGARHVLRLVDGSLNNVPLRTDGGQTADSPGGFTVASENPVYILGDYNSNAADSANWPNDTTAALELTDDKAGHAAAAVIADTVTLLSNNWMDLESMTAPVTSLGNRTAATTTSYRLAISAGKNRSFAYSTTTLWNATAADTGTDGGVHNFLRYLENWNTTAHYKGSLVSLYYSTYNTGFYKCCTTVYSPPTRDYSFDLDFTRPGGLPPGTPLFKDVESLGFRQLFTTRTN